MPHSDISATAILNNKPSNKKTVMVLLYNDLRVHDNAALAHAADLAGKEGHLLIIYAADLLALVLDNQWSCAYHFEAMGHERARFLTESLADLDNSLQRLGNRLLHVDDATPLYTLIETYNVTDICISNTADYAQNLAYDALQDKYPSIKWHQSSTATLFATLPTDGLPKSFTQFRKKVEAANDLLNAKDNISITPVPGYLPPLPDNVAVDEALFFQPKRVESISQWRGGESSAIQHLNDYFNSDAPSTYKDTRNALDDWSHSTKFSAWLANGTLSVKVLLNRLRQYEREVIANESTYWIWFELLWREYFYWYAIMHQKNLFLFQGISAKAPTGQHDETKFISWTTGNTRYPIINACMRQLNQTGYMSNRGRQLVASCFIYELGLDWRYGAAYFEQQLIDYNVASNWGNWQYLAGVGADPRGCRQFNLTKQTERYDPNCEFIDRWQDS